MFQFGVNLSTPSLLIRGKVLMNFNWMPGNNLEETKTILYCFIKEHESG
jgi:hypothetical protein